MLEHLIDLWLLLLIALYDIKVALHELFVQVVLATLC